MPYSFSLYRDLTHKIIKFSSVAEYNDSYMSHYLDDNDLHVLNASAIIDALDTKLNLSGGTLSGSLSLQQSAQYKSASYKYGINARNSDIINLNALYMQHVAANTADGIRFVRNPASGSWAYNGSKWDSLTAKDGVLYFKADDPIAGSDFSTANIILHSGNYNSYALPLTGGTLTGNLTVSNNGTVTATKFIGDLQGKLVNARTISISSAAGTTGTSFDGSANVSLIIPKTLTGFTSITSTTFVGALSGNATSADKLNTNAGSSSQPIYFSGGKPVAITGAIGNDITGNAATATKLQTSRTIQLGTAVTSTAQSFDGSANITIPVNSVKEAYLSWGGKNISGDVTPLDMAMYNEFGANRLAYLPADCYIIEKSTDGGATWSDYGASDAQKISLGTLSTTFYTGGTSSNAASNYQLRITIIAKEGKLYTYLAKTLIYLNTAGVTGAKCLVETALNETPDTFTTYDTYDVSGWSGWNSLPTRYTFGGGANQNGRPRKTRFTFYYSGKGSSYQNSQLSVLRIRMFGTPLWSSPSTLASTGHIYTYDVDKNTIFPAQVTATQFNGPLNGNATTATALKTGRAIIIGAEAQSDASSGVSFNGSANVTLKLPQTISGFTKITSTEFAGKLTGNAASASKLINSSAENYAVGSATLPVYFNNGVPVACTADSVFGALSWAAGTTAGPTLKITVAGKERTAVIPTASQGGSGIVTTGDQTWAGKKTFQGQVVLQANVYTDAANTGALNLSNSNIFGVNGIYFADLSDNAQEGLQWYRDSTHVDTIYVKSGMIYFTPNRTYGSAGTDRVIPTVTSSTTTAGYPIISTTTAGNNIYNQNVTIADNVITLKSMTVNNATVEGKLVGNLEGKLVNARNFVINVTAASVATDATAGPATSFDASSNVALQLPSILKGFASITSTAFIGALTGNATSADKLNTNAGSTTQPIYFKDGIPTAITGAIANSTTGNAATATKLATSRTLSISGTAGGTAPSFNGTGNVTLSVPATMTGFTSITSTTFVGALTGNASSASKLTTNAGSTTQPIYFKDGVPTAITGSIANSTTGNAGTATKLATARTITLSGAVTGSASFDGSSNVTISTITNHTHSYLPLSGGTMSGSKVYTKASGSVFDTFTRSDTGASLSVGVGSGGANYGLYDQTLGKWIIYSDGTDARTQLKLYGAVWNDYAEYRQADTMKPGCCIVERGDDTLAKSTKRLQRGAEIVSDTFGFAIGETEKCKTPIATTGRVLAYGYESRDEFKAHIGYPVCSGPNGTVSIMTLEEERNYPSCIIGYVSAVPSYEEWGTGNVKVNGRIWIRVR